MYPHKMGGIVQTLMTVLSLGAVRGRPAAVRNARIPTRPDTSARASITSAQLRKERYFEMARHSRWTQ